MNLVDLILVAVFVMAVITGYRAGFIATFYGLVTWVVALVGALVLRGPVAALLQSFLSLPGPVVGGMAFIATLLAIEAALAIVGRAIVSPFIAIVHRQRLLAAADRVLGVVPAVLRSMLVAAVAMAALLVMPVGNDVRSAIDGSWAARTLISQAAQVGQIVSAQSLFGSLGSGFDDAPLFVTRLAEGQRQTLDLPDDLVLEADPEAERQLIALANEERVARGLAPLELDPRLVPVARAHSEEMFRLKYFSHESPVTGTPFDRIGRAGIRYSAAGENLAYARSVSVAHRGLMDSPGHRENILRPEYTRIGVGVISAGPYGRMFTQLFLTP